MVPFIAVIFPPQRAIKKTFIFKKKLDASCILLRPCRSHTFKHIWYTITTFRKTIVYIENRFYWAFCRVRSLFSHYWSNLKEKKVILMSNTIRTGMKVIFRHWVKLFPAQLKTILLQLCVNTSYKLAVKHINSFHLLSQEGSKPKLSGERRDMLSWWRMDGGKSEGNLKMKILCATVWLAILYFLRKILVDKIRVLSVTLVEVH